MMRESVVLLSLCLLLVLAHHGESRVLSNDMFNLQREESVEAVDVSIAKGNHHGAAPKPVPCTWVCGEGENHNYECNCIPNAPQQVELVEAQKTTGARKPVPCTWVCGEGENHNYECSCVPDAPKKDELLQAEKMAGAHAKARKPAPCTWVCGEGENHNYECNCVPNASMEDQFTGALVNPPVGGHH